MFNQNGDILFFMDGRDVPVLFGIRTADKISIVVVEEISVPVA